jgi:predicted component of type VI protein secretion system
VIPLRRPVQLIGRHPECDIRIDLAKISRRHCCIALVYDRVVVRDLGSRNGVRVNGLLVEEANLRPGDEVAIGPLIYRMEGMADVPGSPLATPVANPVPPAPSTPPSLPNLGNGSGTSDEDLVPLLDL